MSRKTCLRSDMGRGHFMLCLCFSSPLAIRQELTEMPLLSKGRWRSKGWSSDVDYPYEDDLCGYVRHLYPLQKKNNIIGHIQIYSCKGNSCHVTNVAYIFSYTEKCFVVCGIRGQCSTDVVGLNVCYLVTRTHQTMELMTQDVSLWFCPSKAWMGV